MDKKRAFIDVVDYVFDDLSDYDMFSEDTLSSAVEFFNEFKENKISNKITENGQKILRWLQENTNSSLKTFTAKEIAEGLSTTGRSVAGSMRKLVKDEYVEKQGKDPIQYSLTAKGEDWS